MLTNERLDRLRARKAAAVAIAQEPVVLLTPIAIAPMLAPPVTHALTAPPIVAPEANWLAKATNVALDNWKFAAAALAGTLLDFILRHVRL